MKFQKAFYRYTGLFALFIFCALCAGCVTTGSQTLNSLLNTENVYTQSQEAWDTFKYVDANKRLPQAYPTKAERQAQYQEIQAAWNAVKNAYKQKGYSDDFFETFPKDMREIMFKLADIKKRMNAFSGGAGADQSAAVLNAKTQDTVTIPPYSMIEYTFRGNCMDPSRPAPRAGDKFQLIAIGDLIVDELLPVYQGLMRLTASGDAVAKRHQQQLVWAFRTIDKPNSYSASLNQEQLDLLNRCYPNGAAIFNRTRQQEQMTGQITQLLGDVARDVLPTINIGGASFNPVDLVTAKDPAAVVTGQVERLTSLPINEAVQNTGFEYNQLAEGVYSHAVGTAGLTVKLRIINSTPHTAYFNPLLYTAQAQRETQRVSMAPVPPNQVTNTDLSGGSKNNNQAVKDDNNFFSKTTNDIAKFPASHVPQDIYQETFKNYQVNLNGMNYRPDWLVADVIISYLQADIELDTGKNLLTGVEMHTVDKAILYGTLAATHSVRLVMSHRNGTEFIKRPNQELGSLEKRLHAWNEISNKQQLADALDVELAKLQKAFKYIGIILNAYSTVQPEQKTMVSNEFVRQLLEAYDYHLEQIFKYNKTSVWGDFF